MNDVTKRQLSKMREDWDSRARENARHYVDSSKTDWSDEEFFASGELAVEREVLSDMTNICQGKHPSQMRVLEIGCGAGRVTRALARVFGQVYAVDVSGEMVKRARQAVKPYRRRVFIFRNNGRDLRAIPNRQFDFAFSTVVFQHIPSRDVIENYVREAYRLLRPGALFKFQVQGDVAVESDAEDTWLGVPFSDEQAVEMAQRCGFEPRYRVNAGTQYFMLWFFKPADAPAPPGFLRRRLNAVHRRLIAKDDHGQTQR